MSRISTPPPGNFSITFSQPDASGDFTAHFVDTKADVPSQDFSTVEVEVVIGDDTFTEQVALVLDGKVWRLV